MNEIDYWRLSGELSIEHAAYLIIGEVPKVEGMVEYDENGEVIPVQKEGNPKFVATITGMTNAIISGQLKANVQHVIENKFDVMAELWVEIETNEVDRQRTMVSVPELKKWLSSNGLEPDFFFPEKSPVLDYLDPSHPRYAPKLAAAIHAWLAIGDDSTLKGKSPKQALDKWLRENAAGFNMIDSDGNPVNQAVEDCSKVANWNLGGGSPKTP